MFRSDVQRDPAVEPSAVDHECVALIRANRRSHPLGIQLVWKLTTVGGDDVKDVVRLEEVDESFRRLNDLDGIFRLHGSRVSPREAKGGVIEFRRLVHLRPCRCERQRSGAFLRTVPLAGAAPAPVARDIGDARPSPHAAEVRFAIGEPRDLGSGRCRLADGERRTERQCEQENCRMCQTTNANAHVSFLRQFRVT